MHVLIILRVDKSQRKRHYTGHVHSGPTAVKIAQDAATNICYTTYMQNIIFGITFIVIGVLITFGQFNFLEMNIILTTLLNVSVSLLGLLMILREQGRRAARRATKRTVKEKDTNKNRLASELSSEEDTA